MNPVSPRRLTENEEIFARQNQEFVATIERSLGHELQPGATLNFYCECSNEFCMDYVHITHEDYRRAHTTENMFVIKPGHEIVAIEAVIATQEHYLVVAKYLLPPTPNDPFSS